MKEPLNIGEDIQRRRLLEPRGFPETIKRNGKIFVRVKVWSMDGGSNAAARYWPQAESWETFSNNIFVLSQHIDGAWVDRHHHIENGMFLIRDIVRSINDAARTWQQLRTMRETALNLGEIALAYGVRGNVAQKGLSAITAKGMVETWPAMVAFLAVGYARFASLETSLLLQLVNIETIVQNYSYDPEPQESGGE